MRDCLIIGGGPAGLMAAVYLARYRRSVTVLHAGQPRAAWIPASHNCPGFPDGISGVDFLARLAEQARAAGALIEACHVEELTREAEGFKAGIHRARLVLVATGSADVLPDMPDLEDAVWRGLVRFCPVCDGPEAADKRLLLLFGEKEAAGHARFLRAYSRDVTMVPQSSRALEALALDELPPGVTLLQTPPRAITATPTGIRLETEQGVEEFDVLYPLLGSRPGTKFLHGLKPRMDKSGALITDASQETSIPGVFAAGDVVDTLDQIAVAVGQAALAASAMHQRLAPRWA